MPSSAIRFLWLGVLITPLLGAMILTAVGIRIEARDDINYLIELQSRPYFLAAPDQLSWALLKFLTELVPDPTLGLRISGLFVFLTTCIAILLKKSGDKAPFIFFVSILPIFWIVYFNQIRLGLAIAIYLLLLARGRTLAAPFGAALAHTSAIAFIFPPAIILGPFALSSLELLDPTSFAAIRFAAYRDAEYLLMPWYFGWELLAVSLSYAWGRRWGYAAGLVICAIAVRLLAEMISVDVARRLLELSLFIYSPIVDYLRSKSAPPGQVLIVYGLLGLLSLYAAFAGKVVSF